MCTSVHMNAHMSTHVSHFRVFEHESALHERETGHSCSHGFTVDQRLTVSSSHPSHHVVITEKLNAFAVF